MNKAETRTYRATLEPDEFEYLSRITCDLRDSEPKLAYADWLASRGDPRATFLRKFVAATESLSDSTEFPDSSWLPQAWKNVLGVSLVEGIVRFGLVDAKDIILGLSRPAVGVLTQPVNEELIAIGQSKFGGLSDLPEHTVWPIGKPLNAYQRGGPLGFVGQILLSDIAGMLAAKDLPGEGLLSLFVYQDWEKGYQPNAAGEISKDTILMYLPQSTTLVRHPAPPELDIEFNGISPACSLFFCETLDLPDLGDEQAISTYLEECGDKNRWEQYVGLRKVLGGLEHHLLGYSVHGRYLYDPSPGPDWTHLLCVHSDENLKWNWCDGQNLAVFVHNDDVKNSEFERVESYAS